MLDKVLSTGLDTVRDVVPLVIVLLVFQVAVLRRRLPNLPRMLSGVACVMIGLTLFLVGLDEALFPVGRAMARQLTEAVLSGGGAVDWTSYVLVYAFAAAIGFATAIAEPALIAVCLKASDVSGGSINAFWLRVAVALGAALGVAVGAFRIVTGTPLYAFIIVGYLVVLAQTLTAPRIIVPLAYDSGGVTTSTVTVPIVTALGLGLAAAIPGRSVLVDGFGMIALACLFPIMTVLAYAWAADRWARRRRTVPPEGQP